MSIFHTIIFDDATGRFDSRNPLGRSAPLPEQVTGLAFISSTTTSITFSWNAAQFADTYRVWVNSEPTPRVTGITGTQYTLTGLSSDSSFTIRVQGENAAGMGELSDSRVMTTAQQTQPGGPVTYTHYASPTGGGNGLSPASPFTISQFWSVAQPGSVLGLLDGVYTGSNSMITPPSGLNGVSGNPITVRAVNDGMVRINGQNSRPPVFLSNNSWFVLEGFNAHDSNATVIQITSGSSHNIIRRVVAWNGRDDGTHTGSNHMVISVGGNSQYNLIEDCAAFGTGRKMITHRTGSTTRGNIFRRCWAMHGGSSRTDGVLVYSPFYNAFDGLIENCIGTIDFSFPAVGFPRILFTDHQQGVSNKYTNSGYKGCIGYVLSSQNTQSQRGIQVLGSNSDASGIYFKDCVAFSGKSQITVTGLETSSIAVNPHDLFAHNLTRIGATPGYITSDWQQSNNVSGSTVGGVPNIFNGAGSQGARICRRYVNGVLTNEPLWPWPMDDRIYAALQIAGKSPIFVTQVIESIFGAIPTACRS